MVHTQTKLEAVTTSTSSIPIWMWILFGMLTSMIFAAITVLICTKKIRKKKEKKKSEKEKRRKSRRVDENTGLLSSQRSRSGYSSDSKRKASITPRFADAIKAQMLIEEGSYVSKVESKKNIKEQKSAFGFGGLFPIWGEDATSRSRKIGSPSAYSNSSFGSDHPEKSPRRPAKIASRRSSLVPSDDGAYMGASPRHLGGNGSAPPSPRRSVSNPVAASPRRLGNMTLPVNLKRGTSAPSSPRRLGGAASASADLERSDSKRSYYMGPDMKKSGTSPAVSSSASFRRSGNQNL